MGIDMRKLPEDTLTWHEIEVLRAFARFGERRFRLDPIWDIDWNERRLSAFDVEGIPNGEIKSPSIIYRFLSSAMDIIIKTFYLLK
jgi:hypothetical protein